MKDIILLIMLADGGLHETHYPLTREAEWRCVQDAAKQERKGLTAYCIIPEPEKVGRLVDYQE